MAAMEGGGFVALNDPGEPAPERMPRRRAAGLAAVSLAAASLGLLLWTPSVTDSPADGVQLASHPPVDLTCLPHTGGGCTLEACYEWRGDTTCAADHNCDCNNGCAGWTGRCTIARNTLVATGAQIRNAYWPDNLLYMSSVGGVYIEAGPSGTSGDFSVYRMASSSTEDERYMFVSDMYPDYTIGQSFTSSFTSVAVASASAPGVSMSISPVDCGAAYSNHGYTCQGGEFTIRVSDITTPGIGPYIYARYYSKSITTSTSDPGPQGYWFLTPAFVQMAHADPVEMSYWTDVCHTCFCRHPGLHAHHGCVESCVSFCLTDPDDENCNSCTEVTRPTTTALTTTLPPEVATAAERANYHYICEHCFCLFPHHGPFHARHTQCITACTEHCIRYEGSGCDRCPAAATTTTTTTTTTVPCPPHSTGGNNPNCACDLGYANDGTSVPSWDGSEWTGECALVDCPENGHGAPACECNHGYTNDGSRTLGWTGVSWSGQCVQVQCPMYSEGFPDCACLSGFAGTLTWDADSSTWSGSCEVASCPTHAHGKPDCACATGYTGELSWSGSEWTGTCTLSDCPENAEGAPECKCSHHFHAVQPVVWGGDAWTGECVRAPCPENSRGEICACVAGYSDTADPISWGDSAWAGSCAEVPCPDNAHGSPTCECDDGYAVMGPLNTATKSLGFSAGAYIGECSLLPCPANSQGAPACACDAGYTDAGSELTLSGAQWTGTCALASCPDNAHGAPNCVCDSGFTGSLTWSGSEWSGTCALADCPHRAEGAPDCVCEKHFIPDDVPLSWTGTHWDGRCKSEFRATCQDIFCTFPGQDNSHHSPCVTDCVAWCIDNPSDCMVNEEGAPADDDAQASYGDECASVCRGSLDVTCESDCESQCAANPTSCAVGGFNLLRMRNKFLSGRVVQR